MDTEAKNHHSRWMWVSLVLGVAAVGLLAWVMTLQSDLDSTQADLDSTSQQLSSTRQELETTTKKLGESQKQVEQLEAELTSDRRRRLGGAVLAAGGPSAAQKVYDDLTDQLGATEAELEAAQQDVDDAAREAERASDDAEAAKREASAADDAADRTKAFTAQLQAEVKAARSRSGVVSDCVRAYVAAFGGLFEGEGVREQAPGVREQFAALAGDCGDAATGG